MVVVVHGEQQRPVPVAVGHGVMVLQQRLVPVAVVHGGLVLQRHAVPVHSEVLL